MDQRPADPAISTNNDGIPADLKLSGHLIAIHRIVRHTLDLGQSLQMANSTVRCWIQSAQGNQRASFKNIFIKSDKRRYNEVISVKFSKFQDFVAIKLYATIYQKLNNASLSKKIRQHHELFNKNIRKYMKNKSARSIIFKFH